MPSTTASGSVATVASVPITKACARSSSPGRARRCRCGRCRTRGRWPIRVRAPAPISMPTRPRCPKRQRSGSRTCGRPDGRGDAHAAMRAAQQRGGANAASAAKASLPNAPSTARDPALRGQVGRSRRRIQAGSRAPAGCHAPNGSFGQAQVGERVRRSRACRSGAPISIEHARCWWRRSRSAPSSRRFWRRRQRAAEMQAVGGRHQREQRQHDAGLRTRPVAQHLHQLARRLAARARTPSRSAPANIANSTTSVQSRTILAWRSVQLHARVGSR